VAIKLYMDAHIPKAVTNGLRLRGIDLLTAQEDNADKLSDSELLERATVLNRVLFTFDDDLLVEAAKRQRLSIPFSGVIYTSPLNISIGACIKDLEIIAQSGEPEDLANRVEFLPL
jgi:predicted nuclease of predicted toxin-antitoxin system